MFAPASPFACSAYFLCHIELLYFALHYRLLALCSLASEQMYEGQKSVLLPLTMWQEKILL